MKKLIFLIILLAINNYAFADPDFFCPPEIICTGTTWDSCTIPGVDESQWSIESETTGWIPAGTSHFNGAYRSRAGEYAGYPQCSYQHSLYANSVIIRYIHFTPNVDTAYPGNKWTSEALANLCEITNIEECPFLPPYK